MSEQVVAQRGWAALCAAAVDFRDLECWEWMTDGDLFGVEDPETGEIGYCCVLGMLRDLFALNVYRGSEGLAGYLRLREAPDLTGDEVGPLYTSALAGSQLCLSASFEDRSQLHRKDLETIRWLGLKFRGRNQWPLFRSYRPGFVPWFLTPPEARFLAVALRQATQVASRFKRNPGLLDPPSGDTDVYLLRVLEGNSWTDRWHKPAPYTPRRPEPVLDEVRLARIQRAGFPCRGTWQAACLLLPFAIEESEPPYIPMGFPVLTDEGPALGLDLFPPGEVERSLPEKFLDLVERLEYLPRLLLVAGEETFPLLKPVAAKLAVRIKQADGLPGIDAFLTSMQEFMNRR